MTEGTPEISELVEQLEALSPSMPLDAGWDGDSLLAVARDDAYGPNARLNACELLLRRDERRFKSLIGEATVAEVYASALQAGAADLNEWGFLGLGDVGALGLRLVACGESAVSALLPLLDVKRSAGSYSGSKEATLGDDDFARVRDFAAFFISKIRRLPFKFHRDDFARRDAEIERLKDSLRDQP